MENSRNKDFRKMRSFKKKWQRLGDAPNTCLCGFFIGQVPGFLTVLIRATE